MSLEVGAGTKLGPEKWKAAVEYLSGCRRVGGALWPLNGQVSLFHLSGPEGVRCKVYGMLRCVLLVRSPARPARPVSGLLVHRLGLHEMVPGHIFRFCAANKQE